MGGPPNKVNLLAEHAVRAPISASGTKPRCESSIGRSAVEGDAAVPRTHPPFALMVGSECEAPRISVGALRNSGLRDFGVNHVESSNFGAPL